MKGPWLGEPWQIDDLTLAIRAAVPGDEGFVTANWLKVHRATGDWPRLMSSRRYFEGHARAIQELIARSRTLVACNVELPDQAFGYVVHAGRWLHWVFVKDQWRRLGIGTRLLLRLPPFELVATHWTRAAERCLRRRARYNPFALDDLVS